MRFRPRHYILIAVILAVGVYRLVQSRRIRSAGPINVVTIPAGPKPSSPAWDAFDKAASLRDADDAEFTPARYALQKAIDAAPNDPTTPDVKGCQTWLTYYKQSHETAWRTRSMKHLDTCVQTHHDIG